MTPFNVIIQDSIKIPIKQLEAECVNSIAIRTSHMSDSQAKATKFLVDKRQELFSDPDEKLTFITKVVGTIRTTSDNPVYTKFYPYPMSLKDEIERRIDKLLADGIIRSSGSPYNSPVWIVPKKLDDSGEKKYRMVIDYRKLNSITIADRYPIPEIDEVLLQLGKNKFFSAIDLKSGFHQIPLKEADIEKNAFSVNNGK